MKHSCRQVNTNGDKNIIPPKSPQPPCDKGGNKEGLLKGGRGNFQRKYKWIVLFFILTGIMTVVYGLSREPHEFSSDECAICHFDEKNKPVEIKSEITTACETCHSGVKEMQSHPTDLYPTLHIPEDMLLIKGKFTCITCHYVHPKEKRQFVKKHYFLRRLVRGPLFCSICHTINEKGHIISETVHTGSFRVTDPSVRIDRISLECIVCHDTYIAEPMSSLGAGTWNHTRRLNHPIGIKYKDISARKTRDYRPAGILSKEIRLFDGKIGCGTCHSIYSKRRFMLIMDNIKSRMCLECHIK